MAKLSITPMAMVPRSDMDMPFPAQVEADETSYSQIAV